MAMETKDNGCTEIIDNVLRLSIEQKEYVVSEIGENNWAELNKYYAQGYPNGRGKGKPVFVEAKQLEKLMNFDGTDFGAELFRIQKNVAVIFWEIVEEEPLELSSTEIKAEISKLVGDAIFNLKQQQDPDTLDITYHLYVHQSIVFSRCKLLSEEDQKLFNGRVYQSYANQKKLLPKSKKR